MRLRAERQVTDDSLQMTVTVTGRQPLCGVAGFLIWRTELPGPQVPGITTPGLRLVRGTPDQGHALSIVHGVHSKIPPEGGILGLVYFESDCGGW